MLRTILTLTTLTAALPAFASDLPSRSAPPAPAPVAVLASPLFHGFYAGVTASYLKTRDSNQLGYTSFGGNTPSPQLLLLINPNAATANYNESEYQQALDAGVADQRLPSNTKSSDTLFGGGVTLGYNWALSPIVIGIEADVSSFGGNRDPAFSRDGDSFVTGVVDDVTKVTGLAYSTTTALVQLNQNGTLDWLSTLRGRAGFTIDRAFIYGTGGLAFGRVSGASLSVVSSEDSPGISAEWRGSVSKTQVGWTLGAGIEFAVTPKLSLKGEYLHYDLGTVTYALAPVARGAVGDQSSDYGVNIAGRSSSAGNIVRVGLNYNFSN